MSHNKEAQRSLLNQILVPCDSKCPGQVPGEVYCLLSKQWWNSWKNYIQNENSPHPGPIDNSSLLDKDGDIKIETDTNCGINFGIPPYVIIPLSAWNSLHEWYGGGPTIDRQCIYLPRSNRRFLETRKLRLGVVWSAKPDQVLARRYSRSITVNQFIEDMRKEMKFDPKRIRLIDYWNFRPRAIDPKDWNKTLDEVQINSNQQQYVLIEEMDAHGNWPNEKLYSGLERYPVFQDVPGTDRRPKFSETKRVDSENQGLN